jgi:hypothetical protein
MPMEKKAICSDLNKLIMGTSVREEHDELGHDIILAHKRL